MKKIFLAVAFLMVFGSAALAQHQFNHQQPIHKNLNHHFDGQRVEYYEPQTITVESDVDTRRYHYTYDEDYFLIERETERLYNHVWTSWYVDSYEYDYNGNLIERLKTNVYFDTNDSLETRTYSNGILSEILYQEWFDDEWVNVKKATYNFPSDEEYLVLYWEWDNGVWAPTYLHTFYDDIYVVEQVIQYMEGGAWQNEERRIYVYNEDSGNLEEVHYEFWSVDAFEEFFVQTYHYTNDLYDLVTVDKKLNGSFVPFIKCEYQYDGHGNAVSGQGFAMNSNGTWEPSTEILEIAYDYNYGYVSFSGSSFEASYIELTDVEEQPEPQEITFYPNPVKDVLMIRSDDFQKAEIYSLTGAKLFETMSPKVDVRGLQAGVYLLKVHDLNGVVTSRAVVVE